MKRLVSFGVVAFLYGMMALTGCSIISNNDDHDEDAADILNQDEEGEFKGAAPSSASTATCYFYECPSTGRSYGGTTNYAARHRCELSCGDFCTFVDNVCD